MTRREIGGLDWFRPLAALLVVAIHTGPLLSCCPSANYILTDILARVAVPFFFTVSGYFLVPKLQEQGWCALIPYGKKLLVLYGLSTLLYVPVLVYSGYFSRPGLAGALLQDILFDGTFYHLWYFPAALLGACILCPLVRRLGMGPSWAVCGLLYLLGLLGDSYYGLAAALPPLRALYGLLFQCFDYTRNGLFFAPVFLLLGGWLARRENRRPTAWYGVGLALSLVLLLAEGAAVKFNALPRFDALYLSLPLCLCFLILWLRGLPLPAAPGLRRWALAVYVVHPLCVILIRGGAKAVGLTGLLVDNSPVHYLAVVCLSAVIALPFVLGGRKPPFRLKAGPGSNWTPVL